jgi:hypothetical protein
LTSYTLGVYSLIWGKSHCRVISASGASTSGFRVSRATRTSLKFVLSASLPTGTFRAKVTGKRPSADRFPQFGGLQWTPTDSEKSWCARRDSNPQSCQGSRLRVGCGCQFRHVRINAVGVSRISGSPLHFSPIHLQFFQLRNRSLSKSLGIFPMGSGGASSAEPTAFIG